MNTSVPFVVRKCNINYNRIKFVDKTENVYNETINK